MTRMQLAGGAPPAHIPTTGEPLGRYDGRCSAVGHSAPPVSNAMTMKDSEISLTVLDAFA
jgi:hypothetical protein